MNTASNPAVVPFWRRLGAISKYPLQSGAMLNVALFTGLRLFDLLPLGFIPSTIISMFLWMGILKYAVEVLVQTADGRLSAPEFNPSVSESQAWNQVKLQILLWIMLIGGAYLVGMFLGGIAALVWGAFVLIAMPGATITLAMTNNLWASLNPAGWIELMRAFGWPYFAVAGFCALYQLGGANAAGFASRIPFLPGFVTFLFAWFITHYVLIATFHLMGYLVYQYADRIGHEVRTDALPVKLRNVRDDPDQGLIDEAEAMVTDGRGEEAATLLRNHIVARGGTVVLHDFYRNLQKARQDNPALLHHATLYVPSLVAQNNDKRAIEVLGEAYALDANFSAEVADETLRLATRAAQLGQYQTGLKLIAGFHKRWPKHKDIARNYLFAAKLLTEKLNREDQARALLVQTRTAYPNDALIPEVDAYLGFLDSLASTSLQKRRPEGP